MRAAFPLLRHFSPDGLLALDRCRPVSAQTFLSEAGALARVLPSRRHVINLCVDRYRFAVGFAAALMREQVSLMPPSDVPGVLDLLVARFPDLYCLHDGAPRTDRLPSFVYPEKIDVQIHPQPVPDFPSDQLAVVLFTSGSSGAPAPHLKSWGTLVHSALAAGKRLGAADMPGATIIGTVPQQHSYGLESTILLPLQHGLALNGDRPFYPVDIVACIEAAPRPRILVTTPVHLRAMLADSGELPSVDLIISATAPLAPQLAKEAENRFGGQLIEIYGCSEAGQLATRRTVAGDEWQCFDGIRLHQVGTDIWASGKPVAKEALLNDVIELRTPERFLLHGRTTDLVNIAGKRTSLAYLNYHLNSIAGVVDGIFVMPEELGEKTTRLTAFVVAPTVLANTILKELRRHIDPVFLPRPLLFVDTLPRNDVGKLTRESLLRLVAQRNG